MNVLVLGLSLTIISWIISWTRIPVVYEHAFFPLWLGYILTINGISQYLFKKSLLSNLKYRFILLFVLSVPVWWFFEFCNSFLQNWHYVLGKDVSSLEYNLRASIDFSTVIPAVLSTSYLIKNILDKVTAKKPMNIKINKFFPILILIFGILIFSIMPIFPNQTFPLVWIAGIFVIDPINYLLGFPSILKQISQGIKVNIYSVMLATLFTGFWWEMWNYYSLPKWNYTIPYLGFFKVFEMPILGYLGYLFFGLEILTFVYFISGVSNRIFKKKFEIDL